MYNIMKEINNIVINWLYLKHKQIKSYGEGERWDRGLPILYASLPKIGGEGFVTHTHPSHHNRNSRLY